VVGTCHIVAAAEERSGVVQISGARLYVFLEILLNLCFRKVDLCLAIKEAFCSREVWHVFCRNYFF